MHALFMHLDVPIISQPNTCHVTVVLAADLAHLLFWVLPAAVGSYLPLAQQRNDMTIAASEQEAQGLPTIPDEVVSGVSC